MVNPQSHLDTNPSIHSYDQIDGSKYLPYLIQNAVIILVRIKLRTRVS